MTSEERALARHIAERERRVAEAYKAALKKASTLTERIKHMMGANPIDAEPFSFDKYPQLKKEVDKIIGELYESLENNLSQGINVAWDSAEMDADKLVKSYFGDKINRLSKENVKRYFGRTEEARKAFLNRKNGEGLSLSQRVWRLTEQYKQELEMGLDVGILDGRSANEMARDLKKYLKNPEALFRRVRDERGELQLSKNAKAYHPGQGVYRSAYKNARRLTATETNIAYRTADYERWQKMDFVLGIEVRLSNNHTLNGVPFTDICDELKGRYPKDFKFTGWHPHCRCYAVPILPDIDDFLEQSQRHIDTGDVADYSKNEIKKLPDNFTEWAERNKDRIEDAKLRGKLPYFLRDNFNVKDGRIKNVVSLPNKSNTSAIEKSKSMRSDAMDISVRFLKESTITYNKVEKYDKIPSEEELINKIGGGDKTNGSCVSLALAYAGNKAGYNVTDFRGGESCDYFSRTTYFFAKLVEEVDGLGKTLYSRNDITASFELLKTMEKNREYILITGKHASVVKCVGDGDFKYLELQSAKNNGYFDLNKDILRSRFKATSRRKSKFDIGDLSINVVSTTIIDVEKLGDIDGFDELLGYLNTNKNNQLKGISGTIK